MTCAAPQEAECRTEGHLGAELVLEYAMLRLVIAVLALCQAQLLLGLGELLRLPNSLPKWHDAIL